MSEQGERTGCATFRCTVNTTSLIQSRIERVAGECTSAAAKFIVTLRPTASPHRPSSSRCESLPTPSKVPVTYVSSRSGHRSSAYVYLDAVLAHVCGRARVRHIYNAAFGECVMRARVRARSLSAQARHCLGLHYSCTRAVPTGIIPVLFDSM